MKIAIVDDNAIDAKNVQDYITQYLTEIGQTAEVTQFSDAVSFLKEYQCKYDFIVFDIDMPGMSGIEAAKQLRTLDETVVIMFVTNMPQYALDGFAVDAVDYILKPITYAEFRLKMQKALRYIRASQDQMLLINMANGMVQVASSDIYYVESQLHYVIYHTKSGEYRARASLKDIEGKLEKLHFSRCGSSFLVNLRYVESLQGNDVVVAGEPLRISRRKRQEFLSDFTKYMGGLSG